MPALEHWLHCAGLYLSYCDSCRNEKVETHRAENLKKRLTRSGRTWYHIRRVLSNLGRVCDPLAQLAEHLTFNQGVWSSNLQWVTIPLSPCGRGGMADAPDLGSGANWRMGSSPFARTNCFPCGACGSSSVVECHLAKVDVASPNLVYRSVSQCSKEYWFFFVF